MSIVSLLIGQCGNQVGSQFFDTIYNDIYDGATESIVRFNDDYAIDSMETFFSLERDGVKPEARCVRVDMEEKVIRQINAESDRHSPWRYPRSSICSKRGSGNNWALGYYLNGPSCVDVFNDTLSAELEKCESVDGLIATMGLAGGTGSGVGTYLLCHLGDMFPKVPVLAQLVWPYRKGEVALQAYNTVLTMGHLLCTSPGEAPCGLLFHQNDLLHRACASRLSPYRSRTRAPLSSFDRVSLVELNRLMAHLLGGVLQPYTKTPDGVLCRRRLSRLLFDLTGPRDYRLYQLHCLPYHLNNEARGFATETWPQLLRHTKQMLFTGACFDNDINWCLSPDKLRGHLRQPIVACSNVARGEGALEMSSSEFTTGLMGTVGLAQVLHASSPPPLGVSNRAFNGHSRSLFLATNGGGLVSSTQSTDGDSLSTDVCAPLRLVRSRAWRLLTSSAYLHHYTQFGMQDPRASFLDALAVIEQTIHSYSRLDAS